MVEVLPISYQSQCRENRSAIIAVYSMAQTKFVANFVPKSPSSLAAIGHHAMMISTQVAVNRLVVTRFFFFSGFWLPKSKCRNKGLVFG